MQKAKSLRFYVVACADIMSCVLCNSISSGCSSDSIQLSEQIAQSIQEALVMSKWLARLISCENSERLVILTPVPPLMFTVIVYVVVIQFYLMQGPSLEEVDTLLAFIVASKDTHLVSSSAVCVCACVCLCVLSAPLRNLQIHTC